MNDCAKRGWKGENPSQIPQETPENRHIAGIALADGDKPVLVTQATIKDKIAVITDKGYAKKVKLVEVEPMARYRKGVKVIELNKTNNGDRVVYAGLVKTDIKQFCGSVRQHDDQTVLVIKIQ